VRKFLSTKWAKILLFTLSLLPFGILVWQALHGELGPSPVENLQHTTGDWTLYFLLITLAVTPFRTIFSVPELARFRRMFGLFAFFYVCLHFLTYLGPDQSFSLSSMLKDVYKRPFIAVGFAAFVLLIPLAITSTKGWTIRLGGKRWRQLHRLVYVIGILGVIHYYWLVKSDVRKPLLFGVLLAILLLWRLGNWNSNRKKQVLARESMQRASVNG
jgi:methionine sulfoxide reductase heme-binding subunit